MVSLNSLLSLCFYIDVNECLSNIVLCEDSCTNTNGSFECGCTKDGYTLSSNKRNCEGMITDLQSLSPTYKFADYWEMCSCRCERVYRRCSEWFSSMSRERNMPE